MFPIFAPLQHHHQSLDYAKEHLDLEVEMAVDYLVKLVKVEEPVVTYLLECDQVIVCHPTFPTSSATISSIQRNS